MKVLNNSDVSFRAKFEISEQKDYSFEYDELKKALTKPASTGKDLLDFMAYIYSEEGKEQLKKLPEEDTVELSIFENQGNKTVVDPYFYYKSESMPERQRLDFEYIGLAGCFAESKTMKKTLIEWTNKVSDFINNYKG